MHHLTRTEQQMQEFGAQLARTQPAGPALAIVALSGELGAGKTTLVRGFLRGRGFTGDVRSPTYTLVELYPLSALTVVHADLYRLRDPSDLESLGLRDWAQPGFVWLIEWPERAAGRLPAPDLTVRLSVTPQGHEVSLDAQSALGESWLQELKGT